MVLVGFSKESMKLLEGEDGMMEDEALNVSLSERELLAAIAVMITRSPRGPSTPGSFVGEANLGDTRLSQALEALIPHHAGYEHPSHLVKFSGVTKDFCPRHSASRITVVPEASAFLALCSAS